MTLQRQRAIALACTFSASLIAVNWGVYTYKHHLHRQEFLARFDKVEKSIAHEYLTFHDPDKFYTAMKETQDELAKLDAFASDDSEHWAVLNARTEAKGADRAEGAYYDGYIFGGKEGYDLGYHEGASTAIRRVDEALKKWGLKIKDFKVNPANHVGNIPLSQSMIQKGPVQQ
jgi:hypothetical protein